MIRSSEDPQAIRPWTDFDYWYARYREYAAAVDQRRRESLDQMLNDLSTDDCATDALVAQFEEARSTPQRPMSRVDFEEWWSGLDRPLRDTLQRNYAVGLEAAAEANRSAVRNVLNRLRQR